MVEHVEVVVVDRYGALVLEVVVEVVVVVPVLVDAGGAETPEIWFLFRCQHLLNVTNYAIQVWYAWNWVHLFSMYNCTLTPEMEKAIWITQMQIWPQMWDQNAQKLGV